MTIDRIAFTKTFQTSISTWEKVSMEASVTEEDNEIWAMERLKEQVEKFHKQSNPQLYKNGNGSLVQEWSTYQGLEVVAPAYGPIPKEKTINREYERKQIEIENVSSLEELATFKEYCGKNPDLMPVYMSKMKSLTEKIKV